MIIYADLHFHGPWQTHKESKLESPRTLENFAQHAMTAGLDVMAYTGFISEEGSFWHKFLLPTVDSRFEVAKDGMSVRFTEGKGVEIPLTQEVNSEDGHVLVVGANRILTPGMRFEYTAREAIDCEGRVIVPHALAPFGVGEEIVRRLADKQQDGRRIISALEWDSDLPWPFSKSNYKVQALARELGLPFVYGTDGHSWRRMGKAYTAYESKLPGIDGILDALNSGSVIEDYSKKTTGSFFGAVWHLVRARLLSREK